jgi:battenin
MSTTYSPSSVAGHSVGYGLLAVFDLLVVSWLDTLLDLYNSFFASGTGAAGLVGAFIWWEVRSLGVRTGVGLSAVSLMPVGARRRTHT